MDPDGQDPAPDPRDDDDAVDEDQDVVRVPGQALIAPDEPDAPPSPRLSTAAARALANRITEIGGLLAAASRPDDDTTEARAPAQHSTLQLHPKPHELAQLRGTRDEVEPPQSEVAPPPSEAATGAQPQPAAVDDEDDEPAPRTGEQARVGADTALDVPITSPTTGDDLPVAAPAAQLAIGETLEMPISRGRPMMAALVMAGREATELAEPASDPDVDGPSPTETSPEADAPDPAVPHTQQPRRDSASGERFGQYVLGERLGSGGMAEVYKGVRRMMGGRIEKTVAIKRVLPCFTDDREFLDLLLDEARLTMRLSHPNVAQTLEINRFGGIYFLAIEYIDGPTLETLLRRLHRAGTSIGLEAALFVAMKVAEVLHAAHTLTDESGRSLEVIHRDISPQNIMIDRQGAVKVIDFGVARARDRLVHTRGGAVRGKVSYFSPERAAGRDYDHRSDLFSLGLVLWTMLTGRHPLDGLNHGQSLLELESWTPPSLAEHLPDCPPELDAALTRLLAHDPADRHPDGEAVRRDLAAILYGRDPGYSPLALAAIVATHDAPDPVLSADFALAPAADVPEDVDVSERPTLLHVDSRQLTRARPRRRRMLLPITDRPTMIRARTLVTDVWQTAQQGPLRQRGWLYVLGAVAAVSALLGALTWAIVRTPASSDVRREPVSTTASAEDAPRTPPGLGQLELESHPSGARILLDGRATGSVTPAVLDLPAGNVEITLQREGWVDKTVRISVGEGRRRVMSLEMARAEAVVELHLVPSTTARLSLPQLEGRGRYLVYKGRPVTIDGLLVGKEVVVEIERDGASPVERRFTPNAERDTIVLDLASGQPSEPLTTAP